jgi:hypothetical protein
VPSSSGKVTANGGTNTASLKYQQKKELREHGQETGPPMPIHISGNLCFKKSVTSLRKHGGAQYFNNMSSGPSSSKTVMRNSSTWDAILTTVSAALQVERYGNSSETNYKVDHITYSNAFSFHSSAFRLMSNVTGKR